MMTRQYPDLGGASDWLNQISHVARRIRSTTPIWVVTRHQYGISALVSKTSFGGETSGNVSKCRLFSLVSPPCFFVCLFVCFPTFDMDKLGEICQIKSAKKRASLNPSITAKFEKDLLKTNEKIAPQSRDILQTFV